MNPAPRIEVNCPAWIVLDNGAPPMSCVAVNLSTTGAKLSIRAGLTLPDQFVLKFSETSGIKVLCATVWSREGAVGVRFLSRAN
jgi:hypothetical protein